ncbi:MAG TPA: hypothetical protein VFX02_13370 [Gammaproteobacteria bacterium]|nr:hypothetical protein [Gammaproteobacteria bacterium]
MKIYYKILSLLLIWVVCRTVQAAPDPEDLMDVKWLEARSPHFHIVTDANEKIALKVARDLENFRFFVASMLKVDLVEGLAPTRILAVYHKSNFRDLGLPEKWDGVFQQNVDGPYAIANISRYELDSDQTNWGKHVLLHEYVHYVQRNTFSQLFYPRWYQEGMAEYLSTFKYENNLISFGSAEVLMLRAYALDYLAGKFRRIDLEDLFRTGKINTLSEKRSDTKELGEFYARANAVVHYLNSSNENQQALRNYIAMINEGYDIDSAFKKSFSRSFQDLEKEVLSYLNGNKLMMRKFATDGAFKFPDADITVSPLDASNSSYHIADFLMRFYKSNKIGFDPIMNLMRKSLESDPESVEKKLLVASMLFEENRDEESGRVLKEVLEKHPDDAAALALNGDLLFRKAATHRQVGLPGWEQALEEARKQYRRAIKRDHFNGRAYYGLSMSYALATGDAPVEEAFVALDSARFFSPDPKLLWYEALMRLRAHDNEKAIPLLRRYVGEGGEGVVRVLLDLQEMRLLPKLQVESTAPGRYLYADGSSYEGEWKNRMPEGKGTLIRPNGVKYTGLWKNGLMHGDGEFQNADGYKYKMRFKNGEATGTGEVMFPESGTYKGELLNGLVHGKGESRYVRDGKPDGRFVGQYWLNQRHGPGVFYYENGTSMQYEWVFGNYKIELSEDLTYVGNISPGGKPNGRGICVHKKDNNKIEACQYTDGVPGQVVASEETE